VNCIQCISNQRIISGSDDKTIRVWCLKTNTCIQIINGYSHGVRGIQMLANEIAVSCSDDKTIKIWDLTTTVCIKIFQSENDISSIDLFYCYNFIIYFFYII